MFDGSVSETPATIAARYAPYHSFAVLLADDLMVGEPPCLVEMIEAHAQTGSNMVAVMEIPREQTRRYGVLDVVEDRGKLVRANGVVEKPHPAVAPSTLMIIGCYII